MDRHELRTETFFTTRDKDFLKGAGQQTIGGKPTEVIGRSFRDGFRKGLKERLCRSPSPPARSPAGVDYAYR